jgi:hypothetical protein
MLHYCDETLIRFSVLYEVLPRPAQQGRQVDLQGSHAHERVSSKIDGNELNPLIHWRGHALAAGLSDTVHAAASQPPQAMGKA